MRGIGGDAVGFPILVGEDEHGRRRPFAVAVEFHIVLDFDEPLGQRAIRMRDPAVDVIY